MNKATLDSQVCIHSPLSSRGNKCIRNNATLFYSYPLTFAPFKKTRRVVLSIHSHSSQYLKAYEVIELFYTRFPRSDNNRSYSIPNCNSAIQSPTTLTFLTLPDGALVRSFSGQLICRPVCIVLGVIYLKPSLP